MLIRNDLKIVFLVILVGIFLSGCATKPFHVATVAGESRIAESDVVAVKLDATSAARVESIWSYFGEQKRSQVVTGEIWKKVFVGYKDDAPTLTIISSKLDNTIGAVGFTSRWTYTATSVLRVDGHDIEIHSQGTRAAAMAIYSAMRQCIELAAVDAAHQAEAIISANQNTAASSTITR